MASAFAGSAIETKTCISPRVHRRRHSRVLKGERIVDYRLRAAAGTMSVRLETSNLANYFNVLPPGSEDVAIFVVRVAATKWSRPLAATGEYTVRVYRCAVRHGATRPPATPSPSASPAVPTAEKALGPAPSGDARVRHALPCDRAVAMLDGRCARSLRAVQLRGDSWQSGATPRCISRRRAGSSRCCALHRR